MKNRGAKERIQRKYREEKSKQRQDQDAHLSLFVLLFIVLLLYLAAHLLGVFNDPLLEIRYLGYT
ncbi:hypothetical protein LCM20_01665 [Halobacillus litoralis]|uniref:hypothetical protein n=1 Tax=Halobacillus litoralis TaxID=45668 RepID=UPI001CD50056|nr:hypothetical protein [Halobacillus litoralis]MCA0969294.1 hypothetical protein [Halobacillus litoralis]